MPLRNERKASMSLEEMLQDSTTRRQFDTLKLKIDRWWVDPRKGFQPVLHEDDFGLLHELLWAVEKEVGEYLDH